MAIVQGLLLNVPGCLKEHRTLQIQSLSLCDSLCFQLRDREVLV